MLFGFYLFCFICVSIVSTKDYCRNVFDRCICTDEYVECHGEEKLDGDITKIFHYIKDNVTSIKITGSKLGELPRDTFGSCRHDTSLVLYKLKLVDLSNNNIRDVHRNSFHCIPNIETLILSDNEWKVDRNPIETGHFTSIGKLKHLDMINTFDKAWNGNTRVTIPANVFKETNLTQLETLKLGHNDFFISPLSAANSFCQLTSLKYLDISHNNIRYPSLPNKKDCFENLEILDFSYNRLPVLHQKFMDKLNHLKNLKLVKLDNNPFYCDCRLIETWKWLNSTKVPVNKYELKCAGGYHWSYKGELILDMSLSDLKCFELDSPSDGAVKLVTGMIFAVIGLTLVAL